MAQNLIDGYPQSSGAKRESVLLVAGPNPYTAVSVATPPTGGQVVQAAAFGLKYIEAAEGSLSDDGQYGVRVIHDSNPKQGTTSIRLMWFTAATGAQAGAVDLSARSVRVRAIGI